MFHLCRRRQTLWMVSKSPKTASVTQFIICVNVNRRIGHTAVLNEIGFPVGVGRRQQPGKDDFCRSHVQLVGLGRVYQPWFTAWSNAARGRMEWRRSRAAALKRWSTVAVGFRQVSLHVSLVAGGSSVVAVDEDDGSRARPDRASQSSLSVTASGARQSPWDADSLAGTSRQRPHTAVNSNVLSVSWASARAPAFDHLFSVKR